MKLFILTIVFLFHSLAVARTVAGGTLADDNAVKKVFGLDFTPKSQLDTPEIPIGPRVAITCGHCVANETVPGGGVADDSSEIVFPPRMKAETENTANDYDSLPSGNYGLTFFEKANYSYDVALVILPKGDHYDGPYMTVGKNRVQLHDILTVLGKGLNTSVQGHLCDGHSINHQFAYANFQVIDFYSQRVGFISTGKPAATCGGDSGGYYFRTLPDHSLELVGINSWGTEDGLQQNPTDGVVRNFQGFLSGANDLTSPGLQTWLTKAAADNDLEICGINKVCARIESPFQQ